MPPECVAEDGAVLLVQFLIAFLVILLAGALPDLGPWALEQRELTQRAGRGSERHAQAKQIQIRSGQSSFGILLGLIL